MDVKVVKIVALSDVAEDCEFLDSFDQTTSFTWGDTAHSLVTQEEFVLVFEQAEVTDWAAERELITKRLAEAGPDVMIDLSN